MPSCLHMSWTHPKGKFVLLQLWLCPLTECHASSCLAAYANISGGDWLALVRHWRLWKMDWLILRKVIDANGRELVFKDIGLQNNATDF